MPKRKQPSSASDTEDDNDGRASPFLPKCDNVQVNHTVAPRNQENVPPRIPPPQNGNTFSSSPTPLLDRRYPERSDGVLAKSATDEKSSGRSTGEFGGTSRIPGIPKEKTSSISFQTAGTGRSLQVSNEQLLRAEALVSRPSSEKSRGHDEQVSDDSNVVPLHFDSAQPSTDSTNPPATGLFQSAGCGKAIHVKEEDLTRANDLLNRPAKNTGNHSEFTGSREIHPGGIGKGGRKGRDAANQTAGNTRPLPARVSFGGLDCHSSSSSRERDSIQNTSLSHSASFHSAGSGKTIQVDPEALLRANDMLNRLDSDSSRQTRGGQLHKDHDTNVKHIPRDRSRTKDSQLFQSAGSGKTIQVDDEQLSRANELLNVPVPATTTMRRPPRVSLPSVGDFRTKDGNEKCEKKGAPMALFQSAGSGKTLHVDEEEMERASELLNKPVKTSRHCPSTMPLQNGGTGKEHGEGEGHGTSGTKSGLFASVFQTAASGKTIEIDEDQLARADELLNEPVTNTASRPPRVSLLGTGDLKTNSKNGKFVNEGAPMASFQSAGSGKTLHVDEEAMTRANELLNKPVKRSRDCPLETPLQDGGNDKGLDKGPRQATTGTNVAVSFQSAGSGKTIHVDEEQLSRANEILNVPVTNTSSRPPRVSLPGVGDIRTKAGIEKCGRKGAPMASFQSAGSGKTLHVDEEAMTRASELLNKPVKRSRDCPPKTPLQDGGNDKGLDKGPRQATTRINPGVSFQSAGSGKTINVDEEQLSRANELLNVPVTTTSSRPLRVSLPGVGDFRTKASFEKCGRKGAPMALFQNAGSGKTLHVDEEEMARASELLNKPVKTSRHCPPRMPLQDGGNGRDEGAKQETAGTNAAVSFQSAGSGKTIDVDEEQLSRANELLNVPVTNTSSRPPRVSLPGVGDIRTKASFEKCGGKGAPMALFQNAGSGKTLHVDEEEMARASELLNKPVKTSRHCPPRMPLQDGGNGRGKGPQQGTAGTNAGVSFQSTGSGKTIDVDEEQLSRAKELLNEPAPSTNTSSRPPRVSLPGLGDFRTKDQIEKHENTGVPVASFQGGGSGKSRNVDEEDTRTSELLDGTSQNPAYCPPRVSMHESSFEYKAQESSKKNQSDGECKDISFSSFQLPSSESIDLGQLDIDASPAHESSVKEGKKDLVTQEVILSFVYSQVHDYDCSFTTSRGENEGTNDSKSERPSDRNVTPSSLRGSSLIDITSPPSSHGPGTESIPASLASPGRQARSKAANSGVMSDIQFQSHDEMSNPYKTPYATKHISLTDSRGAAFSSLRANTGHLLEAAIRRGAMSGLDECRIYGVNPLVCGTNSANSESIRFDRETRAPCDRNSARSEGLIGCAADLELALKSAGCNTDKISSVWIRNHSRWINWKLCSIERRFPRFLANRFFTYDRVVAHLCSRYRKEIEDGKRSALRQILNHDASAKRMMTLCIAQVLRKEAESAISFSLELTDGWYSVYAEPDRFLTKKIEDGTLCEGTKVVLSQAELCGGDEGVDPLDEGFKPSEAPYLRIFANGTRIAKWGMKLGFVPQQTKSMDSPSLTVKSMRGIVPGGGIVPRIDVTVLKRHPIQYLTQGDDEPRRTISENEEMERRTKFENKQARFVEKMVSEIEAQCSKVRSHLSIIGS